MDYHAAKYLIWATILGLLSAASLPLGSLIGLQARPKRGIISVLAAFGAGALIAALSVELVAPTVFDLHGDGHHGDPYHNFYALVVGALAGGILYFLLDQLVNAHGGFLRRTATSVTYFQLRRRRRRARIAEELERFPLLEELDPEHIDSLVTMLRPVTYNDGDVVIRQGETCRELIFILTGAVQFVRDGVEAGRLESGQVTGLGGLVLKMATPAAGIAAGSVAALALSRNDFERLREMSPQFDLACRNLTAERLQIFEETLQARRESATQWLREASEAVRSGAVLPSTHELLQAREAHWGAPLAIWLGILLDGLPESFVIGAGLLVMLQAKHQILESLRFVDVIPFTLIAGLFLSNFPEALASSANMRLQGWGKPRIFFLWLSLMIITGVGAGVGFLFAESLGHTWLVFAEGLAAGAMLTMIASAMIPEAVHMGSANAVGLSTLAGFLAAISFKLLE
jgi:zinc transporter ZupT